MPRPYQPGTEWTTQDIHVDDDYPTLMPAGWALGMFIFLTPVRPRGGAFIYAPGSPYRYRPLLADNPEWLHFVRPDLAGPAHELLAEPGDALLFHHLMAHEGSSNVSDPATRHALLARWHPHDRIVPGRKPFEEMSTIEKANSTTYLHRQPGAPSYVPDVTADDRVDGALRRGFGPAGGGIVTQATLRYDGATHVFYVDAAAPTTIRHAASRDWTDWEDRGTIEAPGGSVRSLHVFRQGPDILLFVGDDGGQTHILSSPDLGRWSPMATLPDSGVGSGHYTTGFGSREARGDVVFSISPSDPSTLQARWGQGWQDAAAWAGHALVAAVSPQQEIRDAVVKPVLGEVEFALILDVRDRGELRPSRPVYALSRDSARYDAPPQPLAYAAPSPPHGLRVHARARRYWLVTYLRDVDGWDRLFWGSIDWERTPVTLAEIDSAGALDDAFHVLGWM